MRFNLIMMYNYFVFLFVELLIEELLLKVFVCFGDVFVEGFV